MLARLCASILTVSLLFLNAANCGGQAKAEVKKNGIWVDVAYFEFRGSNKDLDEIVKKLKNNPKKAAGIKPIRYGFLVPGDKQSYEYSVKIANGVLRLEFKYIEIKDKGVECFQSSFVSQWGPNGRPFSVGAGSRKFLRYNKQYPAGTAIIGDGIHRTFIIRLSPRPRLSS